MNLTVLNPYDAKKCECIVTEKFDINLKKKYSRWKINDYRKIYTFTAAIRKRETPRYSAILAVIPCASFYYLNYLVELSPNKIADIGCGINFFKDIIPGVVGFDYNGPEIDIEDVFDSNFSENHTNHFDSAFSIDALHFIPITNFYGRVIEFANIIKSGGRGYLAMNSARLIDNSTPELLLELFGTVNPSNEQIAIYIDQEIKKLPIKWLVVDNLIIDEYNEYIDGNIRLVFEK